MATDTHKLPSLEPPGDQVAHLSSDKGRSAYCGAPGGEHLGHDFGPERASCACGVPICPTCRDMSRVYRENGILP
ncbi:MAG: hypothetical protein ACRDLD_02385 [Thermoleophilaceae bacterium]